MEIRNGLLLPVMENESADVFLFVIGCARNVGEANGFSIMLSTKLQCYANYRNKCARVFDEKKENIERNTSLSWVSHLSYEQEWNIISHISVLR